MRALRAAPVAQWIESRTSNPKVVGSNPTGRASVATTYDDSGSHQESLAHALLTSLPTDLAEVVERWQSLTPEIRAEVFGLIRVNLPKDESGSGVDREFRPTQ